jgi:uncharacterized membrane protein YedE/YeeE
MTNPLAMRAWSPWVVGAAIGVLSWFAFATADKPIGITTAFENTAALAGKAVVPHVEQTHGYDAARAEQGQPPRIDWEWMLVLGVFVGAFLGAWASGSRTRVKVPDLWRSRFGDGVARRFAAAFLGGALMMFGARLAQGCTSGHGISGAMQLAASSWLFLAVMFPAAVVAAFLIHGREGARHVR